LASTPDLESWLVTLARQVPTTRLALGTLAEAETEQAIATVLTSSTMADGALELGRWLHAQTEGQPFYLVETLRTLVDRGILIPHDRVAGSDRSGQDGTGGLSRVPRFSIAPGVDRLPRLVPGTVHDLVRSQLGV
jgi:hypothetical protein